MKKKMLQMEKEKENSDETLQIEKVKLINVQEENKTIHEINKSFNNLLKHEGLPELVRDDLVEKDFDHLSSLGACALCDTDKSANADKENDLNVSTPSETGSETGARSKFSCTFCSFQGESINEYDDHMEKKRRNWGVCEYTTRNNSKIENHKEGSHRHDDDQDDDENKEAEIGMNPSYTWRMG